NAFSVCIHFILFLIIALSPGIASVLGNGTVLLVYCRKRKKLRPPELMTINLALCDLGRAPSHFLCHAWVFGETGCLWYGIQGFVFGIGSLLTTCLISLDRCLKICCLKYGQWIERRHVYLSIALVWVYTLFWALLPAFGFGSYGAEPYGTSCTINWWKMSAPNASKILDILSLFNWTATEYYRQIYHNPESKWSDVNNMNSASIMLRSTLDKEAISVTRSHQPFSCLPPVVTLIPAMFAKSHIMVNPLIYQIMNKEFRHDVYVMVFGQEKAERRQIQGRKESLCERSFRLYHCQSWKRKRSNPISFSVEGENRNLKKENNRGNRSGGRGTDSWADNNSVGADALGFSSFDTRGNRERHGSISRRIDR
uniref:Opsin 9 n=1 Tax=Sander lucioperca TaxID=283035 RepID=A0A8C9YML7_SANLU